MIPYFLCDCHRKQNTLTEISVFRQNSQRYAALFRFLCRCELLTAADVSAILRMAGALCLPAELISEMMEVRTRRFETVTGFEDLELD